MISSHLRAVVRPERNIKSWTALTCQQTAGSPSLRKWQSNRFGWASQQKSPDLAEESQMPLIPDRSGCWRKKERRALRGVRGISSETCVRRCSVAATQTQAADQGDEAEGGGFGDRPERLNVGRLSAINHGRERGPERRGVRLDYDLRGLLSGRHRRAGRHRVEVRADHAGSQPVD